MTESFLPTKPENPYTKAYAQFLEQTRNHKLVVLHQDGLYRHLRIQEPGTRMWSWDVITWPGHIATSGDIANGFVFTREPDMIGFFASAGRGKDHYYSDGAPGIDVPYWADKLCGRSSRDVKKYDSDIFLQLVREHLPAGHQKILDDARLHAGSESEADEWLQENEAHVSSDTWEWDLREYDIHFLFACYCIDLAVRLYLNPESEVEISEL